MMKWISLIVIFLSPFLAEAKGNVSESKADFSEMSLGIERSLYIDLFAFTGYSQFSHSSLTDATTGVQTGLGLTLGVKVASVFFVGFTSDVRMMSQLSTVDAQHLNFASQRFVPLAPTFGYRGEDYTVKLDYQFLGKLDVKKNLADGSSLYLDKPSGFRVSFLFDRIFRVLPIGIYYESIRFSEQALSDSGVNTLSSGFNTWQTGVIINLFL